MAFSCRFRNERKDESRFLLKLQSLDGDTDVDRDRFHFTQGDFPDVTALQVDIEVHAHFPKLPFLLRLGQEGLKGRLVIPHNLEGYEVSPGFQQDCLFRLDIEILRLVRNGHVEVDRLMEHIYKRFFLPLYAIDIDGRDTSWNMVAVNRKQDVFHQEGLFGLGDGSDFPS